MLADNLTIPCDDEFLLTPSGSKYVPELDINNNLDTEEENNNSKSQTVFKRIFILDRIEYRILFALAKLTESYNEYYLCCEIYSNSARYSNIRIFLNNF